MGLRSAQRPARSPRGRKRPERVWRIGVQTTLSRMIRNQTAVSRPSSWATAAICGSTMAGMAPNNRVTRQRSACEGGPPIGSEFSLDEIVATRDGKIVGSTPLMCAPRLSEPAQYHRSNKRQPAAPNNRACPHGLSNIFLPSWAMPGTVTSACVKSSGWRRCISAM